MSRAFKWTGYILFAIFSFALFLYWTFPYNILKDRIIATAEKEMGGGYELRIGELSPSFFTGVVLKDVKVVKRGETPALLLNAEKIKIRASVGALLFGRINFSFKLQTPRTELAGYYKKNDDGFQASLDIDKLDLADVKYIKNVTGLDVTSDINGTVRIVTSQKGAASAGEINLNLNNISLNKSEIDLGEGNKMPLPDLVLAKGKESKINMTVGKGEVTVNSINFANSDLNLSVTGSIKIRQKLEYSVLNLDGIFQPSQVLTQAIPIFFMVENQKTPEGKYPLSIRGRLSKVKVSVGDKQLPF